MGRIKIAVHPLFIVLGIYYLFQGRILEFVICSLSALIHELGHSFVATNRGYRLNKIVLMPFGAVVKGNVRGLKLKDQAIIAFAGPVTNIVIGFFFVALWWFFPVVYPYTEQIVISNLSIGLINLLPIYPLDGGRVSYALIASKIGEKKATKISKIVGLVLSLGLFATFIISLFKTVNYSLLFFSAFSFFGNFNREKQNEYVRFAFLRDEEILKRGVRVNRIAVDKNVTLKRVMGLVDLNAINQVEVYEKGEKIAVLEQKTLENILFQNEIYSKIGDLIKG